MHDEIRDIMVDEKLIDVVREIGSKFTPILDDFKQKVDEEMKYGEESYIRRKLYADIELARLDYTEVEEIDRLLRSHAHIKSSKDKGLLTAFEACLAWKAVSAIMTRFDELRNAMAIQPVKTQLLKRIIATISLTIFCISTASVLLLLTPLRLLHGPLRRRGWKTHQLPVDVMQQAFARGSMYWTGVDTFWEGLDNIELSKSYVTLYSHQSSLDPFILCQSPLAFRLIGKSSLLYLPLLGWLSFLWGHIFIDRGNLEKAKKTLDIALNELRTSQRSLLISPEGTRSKVGRLIDFKKGPFHTALQARFPVLPLLVIGASELWHAKQWTGAPGTLVIRVLPPIQVRDDDTYLTLLRRTQRAYLHAYGERYGPTQRITHWTDAWTMPVAILILWGLARLLGW